MGRIEYIYNPEKWRIILEGKSKIIDDDYIYKMVIGYCDEELSYSEISIFISKQNYESILRGDYYIKKVPYSISKVILYDREYNMIPLVKGKNVEDYIKTKKSLQNN